MAMDANCCWLLQAEPTPQCPCLLEPSTGYGERGIRPEQGNTDHHGHRLVGHGGLQPVSEVHSHSHLAFINTISPVLSSVQVSGYDPQDRKKLCGSFVGES